jgi:hypothetical protein
MDEPRRCTARTSSGAPCRRSPILGGTVCATHGGRAPQVQARARQRLLEASDPAAAALVKQLDAAEPQTVIRAACAILDRANLGRGERIELGAQLGVQPEQIVQVLVAVLTRLGVELDEHVRHVVAQELRAMSQSTRPPLRSVQ